MKKPFLFLIAICFLIGSATYSYALVIDESFDSDPFSNGWETNNPSRFYWDSSNEWLHTENYTNSGDWAMLPIDYNGESFRLSFDIQPTERTTGDVNFGLFGSTKSRNSPDSDETLYGMVGGYGGQIYVAGFNSGQESISSGAGGNLMVAYAWHHFDIFYDASTKSIDLQVTRDGVNVLSWQTTMNYGFSSDLQYLGASMVGSWVISDRYEAANIDNILFSTEVAEKKLHALFVSQDWTSINAWTMYREFKQFDIWADTNPDPLIIIPNTSGGKGKIQEALKNIKCNLNPNDYFIFYYAGHSIEPSDKNFDPEDGDETQRTCPYDINIYDEMLGNGILLTDDELASLLNDQSWDAVYKVILLDTCFAGGFWGDNNPDDTGDLEKLPRISFLGASKECTSSYFLKGVGLGLWTTAIKKFIGRESWIENIADSVFDLDMSEFDGEKVVVANESFAPPGSIVTFDHSYYEPVFYSSDDFEMILPTPVNIAPIANAGPDQTISVGSNCMALVTLDGSYSSDTDGDPLTFTWTWDGGSTTGANPTIQLPLGVNTVILVVNDGVVDSDFDIVKITATDTIPVEITSITATPDTLWPPNHKMVPISVTVTSTDNCDSAPSIQLESIIMNEGELTNTYDATYDSTIGTGNTMNDIQDAEFGTADYNFSLRAERSGKSSGRIYTIIYSATDASGNTTTANATVTVPHNQ